MATIALTGVARSFFSFWRLLLLWLTVDDKTAARLVDRLLNTGVLAE